MFELRALRVRAYGFVFPLVGVAMLVCCDDKPPPSTEVPWPSETKQAPLPLERAAALVEKPAAQAPSQPVAELSDKDFVEGATNRDPFRSFLEQFAQPVRRVIKEQRKVILPRYALDELTLIAVITGGTRPRAMFRDPTGLGVTVKRGDFIGKTGGKIKEILADKVIVEIREESEEKDTQVDRIIDLHAKEEQEKGEDSQ